MRRIKVLHVITGLGPGGAERLVLDLMRHSDSNQFEVRLVSIVDDLRALELYGHRGFTVEVFDLKQSDRITRFQQMRAFMTDFRPDIIHAHMFHSLIAALLASRFMPSPPAVCFTSHSSKHSWGRQKVIQLLTHLRDADIIFSPEQHPNLNTDRTEIIPNGVSFDCKMPIRKLWEPLGPVRLLSVGRLADSKDPLGLLTSVANANLPHLSLEFVGAGPLQDSARALAEKLGISDRVVFHGLRSDVKGLMKNADIFVMHSKWEGMPMALLEAGAEAMPVLATPVGSIPELLREDRGWLASPIQFAEALRELVANPTEAVRAGQRLFAHVSRWHSIQLSVRLHERLYLSLMKETSK